MRFLAGAAQYFLNCILRAYDCQLWRMGMIHVRVLRHFVPEKSTSCGVDKPAIHFRFYLSKLKPYLSHTEGVGSGRTNSLVFFCEKKKLSGHNPPPLNHVFGVTLACTSFPVPAGAIYVVLIIYSWRKQLLSNKTGCTCIRLETL